MNGGSTRPSPARHTVFDGRESRPSWLPAQVSQSQGQFVQVSLPLQLRSPHTGPALATPQTSISASSTGAPAFCTHTFTWVTPATSAKSTVFQAGIAVGVSL